MRIVSTHQKACSRRILTDSSPVNPRCVTKEHEKKANRLSSLIRGLPPRRWGIPHSVMMTYYQPGKQQKFPVSRIPHYLFAPRPPRGTGGAGGGRL